MGHASGAPDLGAIEELKRRIDAVSSIVAMTGYQGRSSPRNRFAIGSLLAVIAAGPRASQIEYQRVLAIVLSLQRRLAVFAVMQMTKKVITLVLA